MATWLADSWAQDAAPPAAPRVGEEDAGRLPAGFSAIIKKSQRTQVYAVQQRYQRQIDELQKQIAEIERKRDEEITSLLTVEQKQALAIILKLREDERKEDSQLRASTAGSTADTK